MTSEPDVFTWSYLYPFLEFSSHTTPIIISFKPHLSNPTPASSRTSQYRQDIQSFYLLDCWRYQRKIPRVREISKVPEQIPRQMPPVTLGQASLLLWEEGLLKHVVNARALSLLCACTHTHTISFSLRKQLPELSCLKTAAGTQHCHVTQIRLHTTYIWAQSKTKSSSVRCMSHLYMHLPDDILFPAGIKFSCSCYQLGRSLFPSPVNQQGSAELAPLFFEQATESWPKSACTKTVLLPLTGVTPERAGYSL